MNGIQIRSFILGFVGLALSIYSLTNGQTEWNTGADGPFTAPKQGRVHHYLWPDGRKIIVGRGTLPAIVSGALSSCLIAGVLTSEGFLLLPSIIYTIAELTTDVSTGIVTTFLICSKFSSSAALVYVVFTSLLIVVNAYLWLGVVQLYEKCCLKSDFATSVSKTESKEEVVLADYDYCDPSPNNYIDELSAELEETEKKLLEEFEDFKKKEMERHNLEVELIQIEIKNDCDQEI